MFFIKNNLLFLALDSHLAKTCVSLPDKNLILLFNDVVNC